MVIHLHLRGSGSSTLRRRIGGFQHLLLPCPSASRRQIFPPSWRNRIFPLPPGGSRGVVSKVVYRPRASESASGTAPLGENENCQSTPSVATARPADPAASSIAAFASSVSAKRNPDDAMLRTLRDTVLEPLLGFRKFTDTQRHALPVLFREDAKSILVRAATGSGKTLCYLLAILKQLGDPRLGPGLFSRATTDHGASVVDGCSAESAALLASDQSKDEEMTEIPPPGVRALVIAPSRELAMQIAHEAEKTLLKKQTSSTSPANKGAANPPHESAHASLCCLVGGLRGRKMDCVELKKRKPNVVIATPGRLLDHFEQTLFFHDLFKHLEIVVLDEADRLCDLGFLGDLKRLLSYLTTANQNPNLRYLLFSATLPATLETNVIARYIDGSVVRVECDQERAGEDAENGRAPDHRKPSGKMENHDETDEWGDEEVDDDLCDASENNNDSTYLRTDKMHQSAEFVSAETLLPALHYALTEELKQNPSNYRIMVFFPTARLTQFMAAFFRELLRFPVLEIHSRKDAHQRLRTSCEFRTNGKPSILFTSDVSARGMDYPDVSLVLQFCAPHNFEQYVHRVGRTARAGKTGRAHLLLSHHEAKFVQVLSANFQLAGVLPDNVVSSLPPGTNDLLGRNSEPTRSRGSLSSSAQEQEQQIFRSGGRLSTTNRNTVDFLDTTQRYYYSEALNAATMSWVSSTSMNSLAAAAFASLLSHFKLYTNVLQLSEDQVVQAAYLILTGCGMVQMPVLSYELAEGLGLQKHPGLKIAHDLRAGVVPTGPLDPVATYNNRVKKRGGGRRGGKRFL
ncbi:unnamed protein product [Amoebophrya sp. A120]|nr:unnamed protein product [Amoebophrya sp. A120]|eukprot:GSA120T00018959001.1